jgi:hypothetical protein
MDITDPRTLKEPVLAVVTCLRDLKGLSTPVEDDVREDVIEMLQALCATEAITNSEMGQLLKQLIVH